MTFVGFIWPRPDALIETARKRELSSDEMLALKSTSFYPPIKLLGLAKGEFEYDKEIYVRTAYNVLRGLDEIEDASDKLSRYEKIGAINRFAFVISEVVRRGQNGKKGIEDIIRGDDFQSVTRKAIEGAADEKARVFLEQFGRGGVLRDVHEIGKEQGGIEIQKALDYCVKSMADGMTSFLNKGPIQTVEQLRNYCFQVAGRIGSEFLNQIIALRDKDESGRPIRLDGKFAEQFGEFLQLTNITKNIRTDFEERRRYLPDCWRVRDVSYEYMMDGDGIAPEHARRKMFERITSLVRGDFRDSIGYVQSVPQNLSGYKAFCLLPLITAQKTIEHMESCGSDRVFKGDTTAVKIPYGIGSILDFSYRSAKSGSSNKWLEQFRENPKDFSFVPDDYAKWSPKWVK